jgi:hypothetical protein
MIGVALWSHFITVFSILAFKIATLVIGFLIVKMGYELIEKGVKGEFKFSTDYKGSKAALASSSPGLLFLLLGVILLCVSVFVEKPFNLEVSQDASMKTTQTGTDLSTQDKPVLPPMSEEVRK